MDTTPITPIPSTSTDVSDPSSTTTTTVQTKPEYEQLFQNYLKTFKNRMSGLNANKTQSEKLAEKLAKKLKGVYSEIYSNNPTFLKNPQFNKYMQVFTKELFKFKSYKEVVRHHNDLILELNRLTRKPEKEMNVVKYYKKIKPLTEKIEEIEKQIFVAEHEELDYDSMNNNSVFTKLPKLHRKVVALWTKREKLLERSTNSGRYMFKKYQCVDSIAHPEINKCVEKLFVNHLKKIKNESVDKSFNFVNIKKTILDEIRDKQLVVMNTDILIQNIWEDLVKEKQRRREHDLFEIHETFMNDLSHESVVDESDPLLETQLAENRKICDEQMNAIFANYPSDEEKEEDYNTMEPLNDGRSESDFELLNNNNNKNNNNEEFESINVKVRNNDNEKSDENIAANTQTTGLPSKINELKEEINPANNPIISPIVSLPSAVLILESQEKVNVSTVEVITIDDNDEHCLSEDDIQIIEIE